MQDALEPEHAVGELAEACRLPSQREHFEAEPIVEVNVHRGDDLRAGMVVPGLDQLVGELALLVVVEQGEARHRLAAARGGLFLDEPRADQVTHRLGSVAEAARHEQAVEALEQLWNRWRE